MAKSWLGHKEEVFDKIERRSLQGNVVYPQEFLASCKGYEFALIRQSSDAFLAVNLEVAKQSFFEDWNWYLVWAPTPRLFLKRDRGQVRLFTPTKLRKGLTKYETSGAVSVWGPDTWARHDFVKDMPLPEERPAPLLTASLDLWDD